MEDLNKSFKKKFHRGGLASSPNSDDKYTDRDAYMRVLKFIRQREKELLYSLEDMVRQFAYEGSYRNKPAYITGGLSSLEYAFGVLGWKEPHPCPENTCEWKGCNKWSHCGTPYKKGYLRCCGEHFKKAQELSNE